MAEQEKAPKPFKVVFNGTKKEEIASAASKYSIFINNVIRPYASVSIIFLKIFYLIKYIFLIYRPQY